VRRVDVLGEAVAAGKREPADQRGAQWRGEQPWRMAGTRHETAG
jgi:hypothetical protein